MSKPQPCPKCSAQVPANSRFCQECGADFTAAASKPARASSQWMIFAAGALAIVVIVGATIALMGSKQPSQPATATAAVVTEIAAAGPLPAWLKTADPSIVADYAWAAEHYEELRYIPCYCGCNSVGHTGNANCYYRWDKDGKIQGYDAHALG